MDPKYLFRKRTAEGKIISMKKWYEDFDDEDYITFRDYINDVLSDKQLPLEQRRYSEHTIAYAQEASECLTAMEDPELDAAQVERLKRAAYGYQYALYTKASSYKFSMDEQGRMTKMICAILEDWRKCYALASANDLASALRYFGEGTTDFSKRKQFHIDFPKKAAAIDICGTLLAEETLWAQYIERNGNVGWDTTKVKAHLGIAEAAARFKVGIEKVHEMISTYGDRKRMSDIRRFITRWEFNQVPGELHRIRGSVTSILDNTLLRRIIVLIDFAISQWVRIPVGEKSRVSLWTYRFDELSKAYNVFSALEGANKHRGFLTQPSHDIL